MQATHIITSNQLKQKVKEEETHIPIINGFERLTLPGHPRHSRCLSLTSARPSDQPCAFTLLSEGRLFPQGVK